MTRGRPRYNPADTHEPRSVTVIGDRFKQPRLASWQMLPEALSPEEDVTVTKAFRSANLDYSVSTHPIYDHNGLAIERFQGVYNDASNKLLNIVGDNYHPIQNMDIANILDPLTQNWQIDTVGQLGDGKAIFVCFDVGSFAIRDVDPVESRIIVVDYKDGSGALKIFNAPYRVFCWNVMPMLSAKSNLTFHIRHGKDGLHNFSMHTEIAAAVGRETHNLRNSFELLAATQISLAEAQQMWENSYPMKKLTKTQQSRRALFGEDGPLSFTDLSSMAQVEAELNYAREEGALQTAKLVREATLKAVEDKYIEFNDQYKEVAGTPWAAWQALVEVEDWKDGRGNVAHDALFGIRAKIKQRGYQEALALAA